MIGKVTKYLSDVHKETKKVIWPTRNELVESSTVVVVLSLLMATFVFIIDYLLNTILKLIL
ncbi:preprotein translocase subunit SecE [bacterium]|nr:preprotein translocase subunit SecE [bacterium]